MNLVEERLLPSVRLPVALVEESKAKLRTATAQRVDEFDSPS
jgi:hypothetical protein